ncbi:MULTISPECIES: inorganic phosphate transporter [Curtobacterium]|uniref:Phosphate transporter n=2 Tax=Curtobacterium TaxID=2034 RepID=A0A9Q2ZM46_9MICO|nr:MULTISPECIES: inorganic phosphate transporter [Curtobacterium]KQR32694.1 phosphate transporter [Curtobacterium sp. Leaf154]MBT1541129.1 inorganic phosphate transporter family protein [Curtobacterium flaccumfaciens pv. flaccumfaciens]MBT1596779.1 inorganic phosphate transporter family protein [Curtobacterium flaccumfaciens pv. flaccumfaciens]MBT1610016.1 inorganic phosphate transporter family protein [Curtobacterium flaccumfaciens pv. poinsettiae]MBT1619426.1 inorganic phosphate transporter 
MDVIVIVTLVIVVALVFDFTNGFHDTANAMATSVATGALKPRTAVIISAVLNVVGAFLSTEVAKTVSQGIIREGQDGIHISPTMIFAGLVGAVLWNLATWYVGLPSSSTHALFGGLIGASIIGAGLNSISWATVVSKVVLPALLSPLIAAVIALVATYLAYVLTKNATTHGAATGFRHGQTISASLVSLAHGTNDAQKTMGVITLTLIAANYQAAGTGPALWVILACGLAIGLGTYMGGWRIMQTVGKKISDVQSPQGFAAETSSAATILISSHLGFALSTTHVTSGAVVGSGLGKKLADVHWSVVGRIVAAWVITLPAAAVVGALATWLASTSAFGLVLVAVLALAAGLTFYVLAKRKPVSHEDITADAAGPTEQPEPQPTGAAN